MIRTSWIFIVLQLSIDTAGDNEIGAGKVDGNKTNLPNLFMSKKSTEAAYLTFKGNKKVSGKLNSSNDNTKMRIEAARGFNYLIPSAKKALF